MSTTALSHDQGSQSPSLVAFRKQFGEAHMVFAYHAAFPLELTPDLLSSLWANFQTNIHGQPMDIPRIVIADLLLSGLCEEVGYELYAIKPNIRHELLVELQNNPAFTLQRIQELASFLSSHVQSELRSNDPDVQDFAQAQSWLSLAYLQPEQAVYELTHALDDAYQSESSDLSRLSSIALNLESPLEKYPDLITYARGMAKHAIGEYEAAKQEFNKLQRASQYFQVSNNEYPIPQDVQEDDVENQNKDQHSWQANAWFDLGLRYLNRQQLFLLVVSLIMLSWPMIIVRPTVLQQGLIALALSFVGQLLLRLESRQQTTSRIRRYLHLSLIVISAIATLRYLYYRSNYTLNMDSWLDGVFSLLLFLAEFYSIVTLLLSYFQTLNLRNRKSIPLDQWPQEKWPTVDIYIPTYNEDVDIVRKTVLGALNTDYPVDKKKVYVLDDGRAEKYRERRYALSCMCAELGCTMLTRDSIEHAKAGNINAALPKTNGQLILILDCDHIPTRSFLQETVGFFFDKEVALVQTPHWFYNSDPFERNLLTKGQIPGIHELFYKVLQKGNDFWNATFFCGSAALIRRKCLLNIGGLATETVTEDCHTSLRLHSLGYRTVYYDRIMVAGLTPEKYSFYVGQQVRWARGMTQILRIENPLFNPRLNLSLSQRLCYFSATSHFLFGFPRLMYSIAPCLFLLFGINSIKGLGLEVLFYALPYFVMSMYAKNIAYKHMQFTYWNAIYEFSISFQVTIVTLLALINPNLGSFNITYKGVSRYLRSFDIDSVRYLIVLGAITAASFLAVPAWLILSPLDTQAVLLCTIWCAFNLIMIVAACLVAFEQPQLRRSHRLLRKLTVKLYSNDGQEWKGTTIDISETGTQIMFDIEPNVSGQVELVVFGDYGALASLDGEIVRTTTDDSLQTKLAINFIDITQAQQDDLAIVIYSDVREWYSQKLENEDNPARSLKFIWLSLQRIFYAEPRLR